MIAEHTLSEEIILNEVRKSGKKLFSASGVLLTRKNTWISSAAGLKGESIGFKRQQWPQRRKIHLFFSKPQNRCERGGYLLCLIWYCSEKLGVFLLLNLKYPFLCSGQFWPYLYIINPLISLPRVKFTQKVSKYSYQVPFQNNNLNQDSGYCHLLSAIVMQWLW